MSGDASKSGEASINAKLAPAFGGERTSEGGRHPSRGAVRPKQSEGTTPGLLAHESRASPLDMPAFSVGRSRYGNTVLEAPPAGSADVTAPVSPDLPANHPAIQTATAMQSTGLPTCAIVATPKESARQGRNFNDLGSKSHGRIATRPIELNNGRTATVVKDGTLRVLVSDVRAASYIKSLIKKP